MQLTIQCHGLHVEGCYESCGTHQVQPGMGVWGVQIRGPQARYSRWRIRDEAPAVERRAGMGVRLFRRTWYQRVVAGAESLQAEKGRVRMFCEQPYGRNFAGHLSCKAVHGAAQACFLGMTIEREGCAHISASQKHHVCKGPTDGWGHQDFASRKCRIGTQTVIEHKACQVILVLDVFHTAKPGIEYRVPSRGSASSALVDSAG